MIVGKFYKFAKSNMTLETNTTYIAAFGRPKFSAKSTERLHHEVAPPAILRLGKCYFFLFSHSSRRCLHSFRVEATQENSSPSVSR